MIGTAAALVVAIALVATTRAEDERYDLCVIADVSGSTVVARPDYLEAFKRVATDAGMHGSGMLYVVLAAADPGADGAPVPTSVAPDSKDDPQTEVAQHVARAAEGLRRALADPPVRTGASAIAEAGLQCADVLDPGDRLVVLSDGIQNSPFTGDFHDVDLSDPGIARLLERLGKNHLLPDLEGVRVALPLLIQHAGGTTIDAGRQQQIGRFWDAWVERTGAIPAEAS
jgi:hypothetical protein